MLFFDKARARWTSFFSGNNPSLVTPGQFTEEFAAAFRKTRPDLKIQIVSDLELKYGDGTDVTFLSNAYARYRMDPAEKAAIIYSMVAGRLEALERSGEESINRSRIVPVIKDRPWLSESLQAIKSRGQKDFPTPLHESYNGELILLYAEDSEHGVRYLHEEMVLKAGITADVLRRLAIENLNRLLPSIECHGGDGVYMLVADGTYESSLILLDDRLWNNGEMEEKVAGEIVVAIPTRDVLLVTGSQSPAGLERLRRSIERLIQEDAPYRVTNKLFVYRGGGFVEFE